MNDGMQTARRGGENGVPGVPPIPLVPNARGYFSEVLAGSPRHMALYEISRGVVKFGPENKKD